MKIIYELESKKDTNRSVIFSDVKPRDIKTITTFLRNLKENEISTKPRFAKVIRQDSDSSIVKLATLAITKSSKNYSINSVEDWRNIGKMVTLKDKKGITDYFYKIPKLRCEDFFPNGELGYGTYPAFITVDKNGNRVEKDFIYIAINPVCEIKNKGKKTYYSPKDIPEDKYDELVKNNVNFDEAREICRSKGDGYHLMTIWEWALISLIMWKCDNIYNPEEYKKMSHNTLKDGIYYLYGQYINWYWIDGFKQDENDNWRFNVINNWRFNKKEYEDKWYNAGKRPEWFKYGRRFENFDVDFEHDRILSVNLFKRALLVGLPIRFTGSVWYITGERMPIRGGGWADGANAGLGALTLNHVRSDSYPDLGFRFAFL